MRRLALFSGGFSLAVFCMVVLLAENQVCPCAVGALLITCVGFLLAKNRVIQRIAILALGIFCGIVYVNWWTELYYAPADLLAGETHKIEAVVTQWPEKTEYGYSVIVELQQEDTPPLTTLLYVDEVGEGLQPGDKIKTIARLKHGDTSSAGEEITYYTAKGIFLYGTTYGALDIVRPEEVPLSLLPAHWSRRLATGIQTTFSEETAPLIMALVTGNRTSLTDTFTSSLQRTGLSHTVAVSGMHLAFLAGLLTLILGRNRRRTALVMIPVSILFALIIGGTPSITRATIMIVMLQLAPLFQRESDGATSLGLALLLILMYNPYAVTHVGLQLSFAAVAGIFCCSQWIYTKLMEKIKIGRTTSVPLRLVQFFFVASVATISATMGAMVFTTPLVAYYFGYVSLISPISNLLTLWAVALCFGGGMVVGCSAMFSLPWAEGLARLVEPLVHYLDWMIEHLGRIPFAALPVTSHVAVGWLVLLYVVVLYALWRRANVVPWLAGGVIILGLLITIGCYVYGNRQDDMSISVLDVGQGQSVLFYMEDTTFLVDCGGSDDVQAGDLAADAIQGLGKRKLDYLILTHCHRDHAGGTEQLMRRMDIGALVLPSSEGEDEGMRSQILALAAQRKIPVLFVENVWEFSMEKGTVTLFPPLGQEDENERGLSVLVTRGSFDALITGDMGAEIEELLVERHSLPQVELYLVGHHGSKYSTSQLLLDEIQPQMAVISVGQNSFGHPAQEVLERLEDMETEIYRTDLMGTITIRRNDMEGE